MSVTNNAGKVLVEIAKALGKAVIAGVGVELARVASGHVQRRFGVRQEDPKKEEEMTPEELRRENQRLKAEVEALKQRLDPVPIPPDVVEGGGSSR